MATIVNNRTGETESTGGRSSALTAVLLLAVVLLLLVFGLPMIRGAFNGTGAGNTGGGNDAGVNVPSQIDGQVDVNVNGPTEGQ